MPGNILRPNPRRLWRKNGIPMLPFLAQVTSRSLRCPARVREPASCVAASLSSVHRRSMASAASESLLQFGERHVSKGLGRIANLVMAKGEGSYVTSTDGQRILDFTSGIGVTNLGHCHPRITAAVAEQNMNLVHGQCSIAFTEPYLRLIEKLLPIMPHNSLDSFFFTTTGSEAVEGAVKMARHITKRQNIIAMQGGYHGRTYGAMALTKSKTIYADGVGPLMPGVFTTPFPSWHQLALSPSASEDEVVSKSLYQLDLLFAQQTTPQDTAAIIVEPVLGEGGYIPAPTSFLLGLRDICDKHGILLIVDEIQSGFGRTGKYFSIEHSGIRPDILTIAKGIANGFPLSAVISRKELTDQLKTGLMGGTYAGNAVSCAAGVAVADAFREEKILDNVQARSKELFDSLSELRSDPKIGPNILDVRGWGLMVGVEFASPTASRYDPMLSPSAPKSMASRVAKRCVEKGLFILTTSVYEVIRFIPPLIISKEDLKVGTDIFAEAVKEIVHEG